MLIVNGEEYDNLADFVDRGLVIFPVESIFLTLREKDEAEKNNYFGIYHFYLIYQDCYIDYEFVFMDSLVDDEGEFLVLAPIYLPGAEIIKYIDPHRNEDELFAEFQIQYQPFSKLDYQTDQYELVDFNRTIQPIYTDDLFVTDGGINYKIQSTDVDLENDYKTINFEYITREMLKKMEEDSFLGIYKTSFVVNTGEIIEEEYTIHDIDNKALYLKAKKFPPRNSTNMPNYIPFNEDSTKMIVLRFIKSEYIPFFNNNNDIF